MERHMALAVLLICLAIKGKIGPLTYCRQPQHWSTSGGFMSAIRDCFRNSKQRFKLQSNKCPLKNFAWITFHLLILFVLFSLRKWKEMYRKCIVLGFFHRNTFSNVSGVFISLKREWKCFASRTIFSRSTHPHKTLRATYNFLLHICRRRY